MKKSMTAASTRMAMPQPGTPCSVATISDPSCPVGFWVTVFPGVTEELERDMFGVFPSGSTVVVELETGIAEILLLVCTIVVEEGMSETLLASCTVVIKELEAEIVDELLLRCIVVVEALGADMVEVSVVSFAILLLLLEILFEIV